MKQFKSTNKKIEPTDTDNNMLNWINECWNEHLKCECYPIISKTHNEYRVYCKCGYNKIHKI